MKGLGVVGFRVKQLATDLAGGPQPLLPQTCLLVKSRVLDRNASRRRHGQDRLLVLGSKRLAIGGVGQVQVAEDLVAATDRDAEKRRHLRMPVRKARRSGIL